MPESLRPATLLKKSLWHRRFPVNLAKFLRTPFSQSTSGRLLLNRCPDLVIKTRFLYKKFLIKGRVFVARYIRSHCETIPKILVKQETSNACA